MGGPALRLICLYLSLLIAPAHDHSCPRTSGRASSQHGLQISPSASLCKSPVYTLDLDGFGSHDVIVVVVLSNPLATLRKFPASLGEVRDRGNGQLSPRSG